MTTLRSPHQAFDEHSQRYDDWYDSPRGLALLATEVECLRPLLARFPRPYLEVGGGTGRFATALGIEHGVDPSPKALERARGRGIGAVVGVAEHLPYGDASFGGVLVAFTLCFVRDPYQALVEARRVLVPGGGLVLGLLLKGTPWADDYVRRGAEGHPLYNAAHFHSRQEIEALLEESSFRVAEYRSTLFQRPGQEVYKVEPTVADYMPGAGFVGIAAIKTEQ